jgi:uncharacterized protein (TIGR00369 family)
MRAALSALPGQIMDEAAARASFAGAIESHSPQFEQFFLARLLDLRFAYRDGCCHIEFESKDFMFNPQGTLHGGVIATVMDISMGHLLNHVDGPGSTLEMKTQYLKAVRSGVLSCKGEFTHRGKGISFLRSTLTDAAGDVIAFATSTWKRHKPN